MKKLLKILGFLLMIVACYGLSFVTICFFSNDFRFVLDVSLIFDISTIILSSVLICFSLLIVLFFFIKAKLIGYRSTIERTDRAGSRLHGDSRWQTEAEVNSNYKQIEWRDIAKTSDAQGFLISSKINKAGHLVVNRAYERHALVIAATRVGKSKFYISPSIQYLSRCPNKPSLFITDPKGELLAENGANLQKQGYTLFVFNLREPTKSHKYNPLALVWDFYHEYQRTKEIETLSRAEELLRELVATIAPQEGKDPIWDLGAQNIIHGLCWALLEDSLDKKYGMTKDKFTLWQIMSLLSQDADLLKSFALRRDKTSDALAKLKNYLNNPAKETIGSYISQTQTRLSSYVDAGMTLLMSGTELQLDDIASKPYAIFCVVPDENKSRYPLATLFTSQIYKYLIHLAEKNKIETGIQALPNDFYFLLDEFGNFPKMPCIEQMVTIGGGRKIWTCIVLQALSQLNEKYSKEIATTILGNIHLQIYMGTPELETNKFFSEFFGSYTVRKNSVSLTSADPSKELSGSTQLEKASLINPDELSRLQQGTIVLKVYKHSPVKTKLVPLFDRDMQTAGCFLLGGPSLEFSASSFNKDKAYYDLIERDNNYDNLSAIVAIDQLEDLLDDTDDAVEASAPTPPIIQQTQQSTADFIRKLKDKID